jgi:8-oxo-dGTP pyrophosphatase MutT (NUDIX family)
MILTAEYVRSLLHRPGRSNARKPLAESGLISAAVLVPLVTRTDETHVLLTRRTDTVETHKGHIAFPGGMVDDLDRDRVDTALRETREEIGIAPESINVVATLDDFITPTGFIITPVVGLLNETPPVTPNPAEVAEVFFVPLSFLTAPENGIREIRMTPSGPRSLWRFDYEGRIIWGATAAILRSLLSRLDLVPDESGV